MPKFKPGKTKEETRRMAARMGSPQLDALVREYEELNKELREEVGKAKELNRELSSAIAECREAMGAVGKSA